MIRVEEGEEEREAGEEKCHKAFGKSKLVATFQSKSRLDATDKGKAQQYFKKSGCRINRK